MFGSAANTAGGNISAQLPYLSPGCTKLGLPCSRAAGYMLCGSARQVASCKVARGRSMGAPPGSCCLVHACIWPPGLTWLCLGNVEWVQSVYYMVATNDGGIWLPPLRSCASGSQLQCGGVPIQL